MALILAFGSVLSVRALAEQIGAPTEGAVLLVCDENNGRARLEALIRACGKSVDSVSEADYRGDQLPGHGCLVTTAAAPYRDAANAGIPVVCVGESAGPVDGVRTVTLENTSATLALGGYTQREFVRFGLFAEASPNLKATYGSVVLPNGRSFPFAATGPNAAYVPWYTEDGLGAVLLGGFLNEFFSGSAVAGRMYVLIDEVYAFSDLDMLMRTTDRLHDNGIPFIVRVMPLYDNLDYPAFQRFTQALLYAQSKGGSVVLHDPFVRAYESEREPLAVRKARAEAAFAGAGVRLLDMSRPPLMLSIGDIHGIKSAARNFGSLPVDTMIAYSLFETDAALEQAVEALNAAWLTLSSYKVRFSEEDTVFTEKEIDADYIFRKAEATSFKRFFTGANQILLIIVSVCAGAFALLLIIGHRLYRRKFYK